MDKDDAKIVLALLMEGKCPHSLSIISPDFEIGLVTAEKLLKSPNLFNLNLIAKGKRYLSEMVRERFRNLIFEHFEKNINIRFQLPKTILEFSNSKVL